MSVSAFNRRWAAVILEALTRHGVRHVCIAPGSRSTPLTLAAAERIALEGTRVMPVLKARRRRKISLTHLSCQPLPS